MNTRTMDRLIAHLNKYFQQSDPLVLHSPESRNPHIDILRYPPTERYPFHKLVTMGASDYKMPRRPNLIAPRNEYMMFIDPGVNLDDHRTMTFYHGCLLMISLYPIKEKTAITYGHSIEWLEDESTDMVGAFLEMPQMIEDAGILCCKLSPFKTIACLQAVLLTRAEIDRLLEIGPEAFSSFLYPDSDERPHFLCEQHRSAKF